MENEKLKNILCAGPSGCSEVWLRCVFQFWAVPLYALAWLPLALVQARFHCRRFSQLGVFSARISFQAVKRTSFQKKLQLQKIRETSE